MDSFDSDRKRILVIDGYGFRALGPLYVINKIVESASKRAKKSLLPCDIFDLICGTSSGALISILLGRLGLDCNSAIAEYKDLVKACCGEDDVRFWERTLAGRQADTSSYVAALSAMITKNSLGEPEPGMLIPGQHVSRTTNACAVVTSAAPNFSNRARCIRSYEGPKSYPPGHRWTVLDAARAASSTPFYLSPLLIDNKYGFRDSAFSGFNNPINLSKNEKKILWPSQTKVLIVSLGTDTSSLVPDSVGKDWEAWSVTQEYNAQFVDAILAKLKGKTNDSQRRTAGYVTESILFSAAEAKATHLQTQDMMLPGELYHRIDPVLGLDKVSLVDSFHGHNVRDAIDLWAASPEGAKLVSATASLLVAKAVDVTPDEYSPLPAGVDKATDGSFLVEKAAEVTPDDIQKLDSPLPLCGVEIAAEVIPDDIRQLRSPVRVENATGGLVPVENVVEAPLPVDTATEEPQHLSSPLRAENFVAEVKDHLLSPLLLETAAHHLDSPVPVEWAAQQLDSPLPVVVEGTPDDIHNSDSPLSAEDIVEVTSDDTQTLDPPLLAENVAEFTQHWDPFIPADDVVARTPDDIQNSNSPLFAEDIVEVTSDDIRNSDSPLPAENVGESTQHLDPFLPVDGVVEVPDDIISLDSPLSAENVVEVTQHLDPFLLVDDDVGGTPDDIQISDSPLPAEDIVEVTPEDVRNSDSPLPVENVVDITQRLDPFLPVDDVVEVTPDDIRSLDSPSSVENVVEVTQHLDLLLLVETATQHLNSRLPVENFAEVTQHLESPLFVETETQHFQLDSPMPVDNDAEVTQHLNAPLPVDDVLKVAPENIQNLNAPLPAETAMQHLDSPLPVETATQHLDSPFPVEMAAQYLDLPLVPVDNVAKVTHSSLLVETASEVIQNLGLPLPVDDVAIQNLDPSLQPEGTVNPGYHPQLDKERPLEIMDYLRKYRVLFIIDDSHSMSGQSWDEAREALSGIADHASKCNNHEISIAFFNSKRVYSETEVQGKGAIQQIFNEDIKPSRGIPMEDALGRHLTDQLRKLNEAVGLPEYAQVRPLEIIILTNGQLEPKIPLLPVTTEIREKKHHPNSIYIKFVQMGSDPKAKSALADLAYTEEVGMVNTVLYDAYTGGKMTSLVLEHILLGGLRIRGRLHSLTFSLPKPASPRRSIRRSISSFTTHTSSVATIYSHAFSSAASLDNGIFYTRRAISQDYLLQRRNSF